MQPETVFDLIATPDRIVASWGFLAIFWGAGVVLAIVATLAWRFRARAWRRWYFTIFAMLWWVGVLLATWHDTSFAATARAAARQGTFQEVEGCLAAFHPGSAEASKSMGADERWTVGGQRFDYGTGNVGFAWKKVEALGGAVHADSHVKVAYVRDGSYGRNHILRLIVTQKACPPAPDPEAR